MKFGILLETIVYYVNSINTASQQETIPQESFGKKFIFARDLCRNNADSFNELIEEINESINNYYDKYVEIDQKLIDNEIIKHNIKKWLKITKEEESYIDSIFYMKSDFKKKNLKIYSFVNQFRKDFLNKIKDFLVRLKDDIKIFKYLAQIDVSFKRDYINLKEALIELTDLRSKIKKELFFSIKVLKNKINISRIIDDGSREILIFSYNIEKMMTNIIRLKEKLRELQKTFKKIFKPSE